MWLEKVVSRTEKIKRIGVLMGGVDCPELSAVVRAVAKAAISQHGLEVFGVQDGYPGLIENRIRPLTLDDVSNSLDQAGTDQKLLRSFCHHAELRI